MRVKCRGYEGNLIFLDAAGECIVSAWCDIVIRSDDGAKIELSRVKEREIEFING